VKTVEHDPDGKVLEHWVESITALHRLQPPPNVHYSRFCCSVTKFSVRLDQYKLNIKQTSQQLETELKLPQLIQYLCCNKQC